MVTCIHDGPRRQAPQTLDLGTIIHGTMRPADIGPALLETLRHVDAARADAIADEHKDAAWGAILEAGRIARLGRGPRALLAVRARAAMEQAQAEHESWTIDALIDALQDYAPDGAYVGAHPGDGADIGVWLADDEP